jgi:glycosyltransferase involved in cell wall biosynthesis
MPPLSISVIVPTKNRVGSLLELLQSLAQCDPPPDEVIVVDDGSDVRLDAVELQKAVPFRLHLLRNDPSVGPGAARNRGVHASRGELLLFTDDDCIVDRGWIGALASQLEVGDELLGGVGGRVLARDPDVFSRYYEFHRILEPRQHDAAHPKRIPYLVTANCAVRREAFMRAGGFDGRIPVAGGEDAALSMRMVRRGYHLEHVPTAVIHHRFRPGLVDFARTFYRYGLGGRYVVDRYLPL